MPDKADRSRPLIADSAKLASLPNPYWDAVKHLVQPPSDNFIHRLMTGGAPQIGSILDDTFVEAYQLREELVRRYSWAITEPGAVQFVAEHSGGRLIDPIAGTGYWALLLTRLGVKVWASDAEPPQDGQVSNAWHPDTRQHIHVRKVDAADAMRLVEVGRLDATLLLSWPPFGTNIADRALAAYPGDRLIYIGEGAGGNSGDGAFFDRLDKEWELTDEYPIAQYACMRDRIHVYARNNGSPVT